MGVAVSGWRLANAVSRAGQLGVVSGTVLDTVMVRRLQDGDAGGHIRRALEHLPIPGVAEELLRRYYLPAGRPDGAPYRLLPMYKQTVTVARQRVTIAANFVETWLAKEGHHGPVGINLLTKVQMPNLASLYGAMLAGVDVVIMGAGIPREIPGALDALAQHRRAELRFEVEGPKSETPETISFDPAEFGVGVELRRPKFLAVVSANSLAMTLARKSNGRVDGFVVEGPTAGGHNAPPRGEMRFNDRGEPLYGERDAVDMGKMRELGLPFWLAGGVASPGGLRDALAQGATGIQVGTLFALCEESGIAPAIRAEMLAASSAGAVSVFTDAKASPTGYPFKLVMRDGHLLGDAGRERVCDLGYLRVAVRSPDGRLVYRCPAEPVADYVRKGGDARDTVGRRCLCNGLTATVGLAQQRANAVEPPIVTSGDDLATLGRLVSGWSELRAERVVQYLMGEATGANSVLGRRP